MSIASAGPESRLMDFIGSWALSRSTFPGSEGGTFVVSAVAGGKGLYSVYRHGNEAEKYEAHVLWGYDSASNQIRVFELNSLGVANLSIGGFDTSGALVIEAYDGASTKLTEPRTFTLSGDTLQVDVRFLADGGEAEHSMTFLRNSAADSDY